MNAIVLDRIKEMLNHNAFKYYVKSESGYITYIPTVKLRIEDDGLHKDDIRGKLILPFQDFGKTWFLDEPEEVKAPVKPVVVIEQPKVKKEEPKPEPKAEPEVINIEVDLTTLDTAKKDEIVKDMGIDLDEFNIITSPNNIFYVTNKNNVWRVLYGGKDNLLKTFKNRGPAILLADALQDKYGGVLKVQNTDKKFITVRSIEELIAKEKAKESK